MSAHRDQEIDLATKVEFLSQPGSYPERPERIDARETHMSWVFLTDGYAYKLKKPVRYPFLDFSTIELRRIDCEEEVRLNRRLAPGVYLGVVALGLDPSGHLSIGSGHPVDWLVKMRRLPVERTLQRAIETNTVIRQDIACLARHLAAFYLSAQKVDIEAATYSLRFEHEIAVSEDALLNPKYLMPVPVVAQIAFALRRFLNNRGHLLDLRVSERRILEGHGDLRPEHVYLGPAPIIADCLEFNAALRVVDPAEELAYLAMECEREGAAFVESWLFAAYTEAADDDPPSELITFYKCYSAFLRARIAIRHLDDRDVPEPQKWHDRALSYLNLAQRYIARLP